MINELSANSHVNPYTSLTPDFVLDALAETGLMGDGRLTALSSYENRVYQIHLEAERTPTQTDGTPVPDSVVAKFYRPGRWTDAQIQEEHDFAAELVAAEVPVVPPLNLQGRTLHHKVFPSNLNRSETPAAGVAVNHKDFQGFSKTLNTFLEKELFPFRPHSTPQWHAHLKHKKTVVFDLLDINLYR